MLWSVSLLAVTLILYASACTPDDENRAAPMLPVLYEGDERILGHFHSADARFLMFLPPATWDCTDDNFEVSRLLAAAKQTVDPEERDEIHEELTSPLVADTPITFLFHQQQIYVAHRRVGGLEIPFRADPITFMEMLWVER